MVEGGKGWTSEEILTNLINHLSQLQELVVMFKDLPHLDRTHLDQIRGGMSQAAYWMKQGENRHGYRKSQQSKEAQEQKEPDTPAMAGSQT